VIPGDKGAESKVNSFILSFRVITSRTGKLSENKKKIINLSKLMAEVKYIGGISLDRYTTAINNVVNKYKGFEHITKRPQYNNLIQMMLRGRVDYVIEYPITVNYVAYKHGIKNNTISYEIEEAETAILPVVFACTDNEWGRKMIQRIDDILVAESQTDDYLDFRLYWYDEESKKILRDFYHKTYLKDKR